MEEKPEELSKKINTQIEKIIECILTDEIQPANIDYLGKLVDIHKDIKNEEYWKEKEEIMRYRDYGNYNDNSYNGYGDNSYGRRDVPGTGRGKYRDGNYGKRGNYRGEEMLDEMSYHYGNYHDSNSYGAKEDSAYKMTEAFKEFGFSIAEELEPKEKMMFKQAMQEIMQELEQ